jgi:hypothetical protein
MKVTAPATRSDFDQFKWVIDVSSTGSAVKYFVEPLRRIQDQGSNQHKDEIIILAIGTPYSIVHLLND